MSKKTTKEQKEAIAEIKRRHLSGSLAYMFLGWVTSSAESQFTGTAAEIVASFYRANSVEIGQCELRKTVEERLKQSQGVVV